MIIPVMQIGKFTSDDLKLFLDYYPQLIGPELAEARQLLLAKKELFFAEDATKAAWCHLYETPAQQHFLAVANGLGAENVVREIAQSSNQIQALPGAVAKACAEIDAWKPTEEEDAQFLKSLQAIYGLLISVANSARSMMVFGYYLNDLIAMVRIGGAKGDRALLSAVKIDPTVLGCPSVVTRMSRAVILDDQKFLGSVRKAMAGKLTKRQQKTYQDMRLVLQVLHETGAPKLNADELYGLFHDELNIVRDEAGEGDVKNNLRQFAYQFMQQKAVS